MIENTLGEIGIEKKRYEIVRKSNKCTKRGLEVDELYDDNDILQQQSATLHILKEETIQWHIRLQFSVQKVQRILNSAGVEAALL